MAKIKGIFSGAISGRVGNVVYRNVNGENIVAQRAAKVYNAQSIGQMIQRAFFYSAMKAEAALYDENIRSIYGYNRSQPTLNKWCSNNMKMWRKEAEGSNEVYYPVSAVGSNCIPATNIKVSDGSLQGGTSNGTFAEISSGTAESSAKSNAVVYDASSLGSLFGENWLYGTLTFIGAYNQENGIPVIKYCQLEPNTDLTEIGTAYANQLISNGSTYASSIEEIDGKYYMPVRDLYLSNPSGAMTILLTEQETQVNLLYVLCNEIKGQNLDRTSSSTSPLMKLVVGDYADVMCQLNYEDDKYTVRLAAMDSFGRYKSFAGYIVSKYDGKNWDYSNSMLYVITNGETTYTCYESEHDDWKLVQWIEAKGYNVDALLNYPPKTDLSRSVQGTLGMK